MADKNSLKKYEILQPLLLALMVTIGILAGRKIEQSSTPEAKIKTTTTTLSKPNSGFLEEATRFIQARYIDSININDVSEMAISSMLHELDPFSAYLSAQRQLLDSALSIEEAFGISVINHHHTWLIDQVVPGSVAWDMPIAPGDLIVRANDSMTNASILQSWQSPQLKLELKAPDQHNSTLVTLLRSNPTEINTVFPVAILKAGIGYIKIKHFGDHTYDEFITALDTLISKHKVKDLVLDLRDNAGGYIEECTRILNQLFKEKNTLLVATQGRTVRKAEYKTDGRQLFDLEKVCILVNARSASASEVFAGAIQDLDRGIIIGQPTYGKGLVQEQYMLSNGGALRLSVARFYLPSGRNLDLSRSENMISKQYLTKNGRKIARSPNIIPDIIVALDTTLAIPGWLSIKPTITAEIFKLKLDQRSGTFNPKSTNEVENKIIRATGLNINKLNKTQQAFLTEEITQAWYLAGKEYSKWLNQHLLKQPEIQSAISYLK
ncbi:MAG: hypothetical protein IPO25_14040 [Saprospiraceae bacterium]|nr:hypothetical protein [Saprospiraceae bacterium]